MSITNNTTSIIKQLDSSIQKKKDENASLSQQEQKNKELLNKQSWEIFYLKMNLGRQKDKLYSFLKENGGIFNLNSEQKNLYAQLLNEQNSLSGNLFSTKKSYSNLNMATIGLHNRQMSNYLTIFNNTFDRGKYLNQQALFAKVQEG